MSEHGTDKPQRRDGPAHSATEHRRGRLADELRANLKKRKALARKRRSGPDRRPDTEADAPDGA
jgi:hypothetical protein